MLPMDWAKFCEWFEEKGFNKPTIIKGVEGRDRFSYYVAITWGKGQDAGSKSYGINANTPTAEELQDIVDHPNLP